MQRHGPEDRLYRSGACVGAFEHPRGGPVTCASLPKGQGAKERLTASLFSRLTHEEVSCGPLCVAPETCLLRETVSGRPRAVVPGMREPAVSFSHAAGRVWGAMAFCRGVGIDAELPAAFDGGYPFSRAFRAEELNTAGTLIGDTLPGAAALVWSLKESAVKALGCGFNLFDPLDVEVTPVGCDGRGLLFHVRAGRILPAQVCWSRWGCWLAVSLLE